MKIIPPLSTPEGRKYVEALPRLGKEDSGTLMAVGFVTAYIVYRWHYNVDPKTQEDKSNWSYLYTADSYTQSIASTIEKERSRHGRTR